MDELKLNLSSRFMRNTIAKIISKAIKKKLGYDITVTINGLEVDVSGEKAQLHIDINADANTKDIMRIVKDLT